MDLETQVPKHFGRSALSNEEAYFAGLFKVCTFRNNLEL
jgi:hypothetical protein